MMQPTVYGFLGSRCPPGLYRSIREHMSSKLRAPLSSPRDWLMDLGFSKMTDYAREKLGLAATTARDKVKLARDLETRPFLREAVRSGKLSPRRALEVLPVARGEGEKPWLLLAATLSVRELRRAVARARGGPAEGAAPEPPDEERWKLLSLPLRPEDRAVVAEAMRLAGELLGRGAPTWQRLEAMAQEFLGSHPAELGEDEVDGPPRRGIPPEELSWRPGDRCSSAGARQRGASWSGTGGQFAESHCGHAKA